MNKILTIEYLYDVFEYSLEHNKDPRLFFANLFLNDDFINMILNKPFDITNVLNVVINSKKSKTNISKNEIRYLSFLVAEFIEKTEIEITRLPSYINASDVINNFTYYHSQDIDVVIFQLITIYNQKYKFRKSTKESFLNEDRLLQNFIKLYPIKRFRDFNLIFDSKIMKRLYIRDNEVLLLANDIDSLIINDYFVQRYCVGNKVFCFTNSKPHLYFKTPLYLLFVHDEGITFIEPSSVEHQFLFSN